MFGDSLLLTLFMTLLIKLTACCGAESLKKISSVYYASPTDRIINKNYVVMLESLGEISWQICSDIIIIIQILNREWHEFIN